MKSFEQFEYETFLLDEELPLSNLSKSKTRTDRRKTQPTQDKVTSSTTGAKSPVPPKEIDGGASSPQAPKIPNRPGYIGSEKKTGVAATIERNKAKAKSKAAGAYYKTRKAANTETGKNVGAAALGAAGGALSYRPDPERADIKGRSGMGTQMRQLGGVGKAAIDGAISGYKARRAKAEKDQRNISKSKVTGTSGSADTKTGSTGLRGLIGSGLKKAAKNFFDPEEAPKTSGGATITGDAEKERYKEGQKRREEQRQKTREKVTPKSQTPASAAATKSPQVTGSDEPKKSRTAEQEKQKAQVDQALGGGTGETKKQNIKKQREVDKVLSQDPTGKTPVPSDIAQDMPPDYRDAGAGSESSTSKSKPKRTVKATTRKRKPSQARQTAKSAVQELENRKSINDDPPQQGGTKGLLAAMQKQEEEENQKKSQKKNRNVKATSVPRSAKRRKSKKSYEELKAEINARESAKKKPNKATERPANKSEVKESRESGLSVSNKKLKMRTYRQMKEDEAKEAALKKAMRKEQYSDWREEFLWEVDKKYPDKVKEIKPMSGKNTIIINPEDESSKYKRGY